MLTFLALVACEPETTTTAQPHHERPPACDVLYGDCPDKLLCTECCPAGGHDDDCWYECDDGFERQIEGPSDFDDAEADVYCHCHPGEYGCGDGV